MKNPMKQTGIMLAAALFMTAGMNCGGPRQVSQKTTAARPAAVTSSSSGPQTSAPAAPDTHMSHALKAFDRYPASAEVTTVASTAPVATTGKTSTVDELDVAIRDASDCLNDNIPQGNKIVILNIESNSANLAEYVIDELIANAINDKNFSVVDRRQLEAIQSEQKFQMSGAVDDKDALVIGKFFGAQTIVSGAMREMGGRYRMTVRALAVQTAVVQSQCNQNISIAASATLTDLVNSGGSRPTSVRTTQMATAPATATASPTTPAAPPIQGTMVPGESLADKLAWLTRTADSHNTYIMEVNADESIAPHRFEYKGAINITIVLRGDNENRTIRLQSNGTMFNVRENVTFILDNNITLHGHRGNNGHMVSVYGTFRMNSGSTITGNTGGGVEVRDAIFEMNGGIISGNTAEYGGGVVVRSGIFTMSGGTITGNTANNGGGVYHGSSPYTNRIFTMSGGTISGNTAKENGGGVFVNGSSNKFTKTGGTITGYNSDQTNGNAVRDEDGNILARRGHAVWVSRD